ncbi:GldG family protein [bacterium]|nr:GldG family protein [candidate division CSSED10-310 bacterium]
MTAGNTRNQNRTTGGILTGTSTLIVIAILVFIQLIAENHNHRFDLTKNKRHSLSDQTLKILENLDDTVQAFSFYRESDPDYETMRDLLIQYSEAGPKFKYVFVDPDSDILTARRYGVTSYSTTVLTCGSRERKVMIPSEKEITNAVLKLTGGDEKKTICFLNLHGELDLESIEARGLNNLKLTLENLNYSVQSLNLLQTKAIPPECSILSVAGPQNDLDPIELDAIRNFLDQGGEGLFLLDPKTVPGLVGLLSDYGLKAGDDLIIDPNGYQNMLQPIVESYPVHEITENFSFGTLFQIARSVNPVDPPPPATTIDVIANTHEDSWAHRNLSESDEIRMEFDPETDTKGPIPIAAVSIKMSDGSGPETRIAVFGDADFVNNNLSQSVGNTALILNTIHWLADEKDLIAIPPKEPISQPMQLSAGQLASAFWIPVVIIPLIILGFGGSRIYHRRKHG